jgi:hypothetical protein
VLTLLVIPISWPRATVETHCCSAPAWSTSIGWRPRLRAAAVDSCLSHASRVPARGLSSHRPSGSSRQPKIRSSQSRSAVRCFLRFVLASSPTVSKPARLSFTDMLRFWGSFDCNVSLYVVKQGFVCLEFDFFTTTCRSHASQNSTSMGPFPPPPEAIISSVSHPRPPRLIQISQQIV